MTSFGEGCQFYSTNFTLLLLACCWLVCMYFANPTELHSPLKCSGRIRRTNLLPLSLPIQPKPYCLELYVWLRDTNGLQEQLHGMAILSLLARIDKVSPDLTTSVVLRLWASLIVYAGTHFSAGKKTVVSCFYCLHISDFVSIFTVWAYASGPVSEAQITRQKE